MTGAYGMSEREVESWQDPRKSAFERIEAFLAATEKQQAEDVRKYTSYSRCEQPPLPSLHSSERG
jgi:hypothetical protein